MTARVMQVSGERLSEFLRQPKGPVARVEVTSPPPHWAPLKPALARFVRTYRDGGTEPPLFSGVPLCLFGSEWSGFPSSARTTAPRGRCSGCHARTSCSFREEVPDELFPISDAPLLQRWREYGAAFLRITGSDQAVTYTPFVERIVSAYHGPVSLEPSVLVSDTVDPSARFVVFPHRAGNGAAAEAQYREVLACVNEILRDLGSNPSGDLIEALGCLPPSPVPVGLEARGNEWHLKMYMRVEEKTPIERQVALDTLSRFAPNMQSVSTVDLQMLGLVLDDAGLLTVKAYIAAQPTEQGPTGFPPSLAPDHPLILLSGNRALATLDIWYRGAQRPNKWDFNVRDQYLAGAAAERLVDENASPQGAVLLRPLLVGPTYRADVVAVGLREKTLALYMELN